MFNDLSTFLLNLFAGLIIAILTAIVTVRLSLNKFRAERWWERKADVYSGLMDSLHQMNKCLDMDIKASQSGREIPDEKEKKLMEEWRRALAEVERVSDMGSFIISNEADRCLKELQDKISTASMDEGWVEYILTLSNATYKCLKSMREIAKRDLNIGN